MSLYSFRKNVPQPPKQKPQRFKSVGSFWDKNKRKIKISVLLVVFFISVGSVFLYESWSEPLLSPITSLTTFQFLRHSELPITGNKVVYGFLPYWTISDTVIQPEMTHLGYFSLGIAADGSLRLRSDDGSYEPGYNKLVSDEQLLEHFATMETQGGSTELVLTQFLSNDIRDFLASKNAQQKLFESLDSVLLAYPFSGINVDIELNGSGTPKMRQDMTDFIKDLHAHINSKYEGISISVDMYASASSNTQIWDIPAIEPYVDYIVVMAYDFHRRGSTQAGPVAPLFGGKEFWDSDINQHLQEFVKMVPAEKVLLGIPFYGYEWQTTSRDSQSHTFPDTGATAPIYKVEKLLERKEELKVQEHWNEEALSPYISYVEDGETYVLYYENSRSISYKLDYVNQLDLGGIAIWAIGYEGDSRELWDVISRKIN